MSQFRVSGFQVLPPIVKNLLIINGLMFLATEVLLAQFSINLRDILGLHWIPSQKFEVYQVITYMFMHGDFTHLFFNMFAVWMFGSAIENAWGAKRFLTYYVLTGIGAAFLHYLILYVTELAPTLALIDGFLNTPNVETLRAIFAEHQLAISPRFHPEISTLLDQTQGSLNTLYSGYETREALDEAVYFFTEYRIHYLNVPNVVGASGSLFGLLLAFGMMFPNVRLFLIFLPIPIKAKYFVMGYGLIELYLGITGSGTNIAHFAHLGGMIFGFILIKLWQKTNHGNTGYY